MSDHKNQKTKHLNFAGINIRYIERDGMLKKIYAALERNESLLISYLNPHVFNLSNKHSEIRENLENCDFVCIDGIGISISARLIYGKKLPRVVANNLFDEFLKSNNKVFNALIIGNTRQEAKEAAKNIQKLNAQVRIKNAWDGFRSDENYSALFKGLDTSPEMILLGCGNPRSDQIMKICREIYPASIIWHIGGGTLRVYAKTKYATPKYLSRLGLEWMHRFIFESNTRKRYTIGVLEFIYFLLASFFHSRKFNLNERKIIINEGLTD
ncbi:WecB/TagA/CpsF family glycosyltransferase [Hyphobacterium sp. CCMP332]|nr:WecB/TagA/CpsF family glycosyltransferase [Hyphobacterium sp. CCMP332]